jgi:putative glycosyltransferase (TIGR04348 family)
MLRSLGHDAFIQTGVPTRAYDVLVALHARHGAEAIRVSCERRPEAPIALILTGTDLYRDILTDRDAKRSLELADRLVVLHPFGERALPRRFRGKTLFVPQSATATPRRARTSVFEVAVVGHLRAEKDPLRAALAARELDESSHVRVVHAGRALDRDLERAAKEEMRTNPRYRWLGELTPRAARSLIARSRVMVLSSVMEGGANVLSEAIAAGTPILASRIACVRALLGDDHPGLFPVGSTRALARLMAKAESDARFRGDLARRSRSRRTLISPAAERAALRDLMRALTRRSPA